MPDVSVEPAVALWSGELASVLVGVDELELAEAALAPVGEDAEALAVGPTAPPEDPVAVDASRAASIGAPAEELSGPEPLPIGAL